MSKKIKIKLTKSFSGRLDSHIGTAKALGLKHINQVKEHEDTPIIRGMIFKIKHMIEILK
jgi:large subunit ribosomal protein L30